MVEVPPSSYKPRALLSKSCPANVEVAVPCTMIFLVVVAAPLTVSPVATAPPPMVEEAKMPIAEVVETDDAATTVNGHAKVSQVEHVNESALPPSETAPPPPSGAVVFTVTLVFCKAVLGKSSDELAALNTCVPAEFV